jgi:hypothetical protein
VTSVREVRNTVLIQRASLARAVSDESLSREILKTVGELLKNPAASTQEVSGAYVCLDTYMLDLLARIP